jgi:hypothetical protein
MIFDFFPVEDSVDHVTTKQSHLNLVPGVGINFFVFMNDLENVRGCRSVSEFKIVKSFFCNGQFVSLVEILNRNFVDDSSDFIVSVFKHDLGLHDLFIELIDFFLILYSFSTLTPLAFSHSNFIQALWHVAIHEALVQRLRVKKVSLEQVKFGRQSFRVFEIRSVSVIKLNCALFQILDFFNFEKDFLELPFQMFGTGADLFFLDEVRS